MASYENRLERLEAAIAPRVQLAAFAWESESDLAAIIARARTRAGFAADDEQVQVTVYRVGWATAGEPLPRSEREVQDIMKKLSDEDLKATLAALDAMDATQPPAPPQIPA